MRLIAHDPWAIPGAVADVDLVDLDTLFRIADFVVIACALTPETRHLVMPSRLALMKPTAYLINTARGPIVDQAALTEALRRPARIAGAGLDVFEQEPVDPNDPILCARQRDRHPARPRLDRRVDPEDRRKRPRRHPSTWPAARCRRTS